MLLFTIMDEPRTKKTLAFGWLLCLLRGHRWEITRTVPCHQYLRQLDPMLGADAVCSCCGAERRDTHNHATCADGGAHHAA